MNEVKTWEELYENVKKATDIVAKTTFKEYKESAYPRRFCDMFGEDSQDKLKESGTYENIYKDVLREDVLQEEGSFQSMDDYEFAIQSGEMGDIIHLIGGEDISSDAQRKNGTICLEFPNGKIIDISKEGYIRTESHNGTKHLLNKKTKDDNNSWKTHKITYMDAINYILNKYDRTPEWFTGHFNLNPNFSWDEKRTKKRNAQIRKRTGRNFDEPKRYNAY